MTEIRSPGTRNSILSTGIRSEDLTSGEHFAQIDSANEKGTDYDQSWELKKLLVSARIRFVRRRAMRCLVLTSRFLRYGTTSCVDSGSYDRLILVHNQRQAIFIDYFRVNC